MRNITPSQVPLTSLPCKLFIDNHFSIYRFDVYLFFIFIFILLFLLRKNNETISLIRE